LGFQPTGEKLAFSKSAGAQVPVMHMELTRAAWIGAKGRRP
jgi:hypothetical protein